MLPKVIPCPICRKDVAIDDPQMPFCSERCRLQDLANWATEKYRIPSPARSSAADEIEDLEEPEGPNL